MSTNTHNPKIIQIIPAPAGYNALYSSGDRGTKHVPVVCLALVETARSDGEVDRNIVPMIGAANEEGNIIAAHDFGAAELVATGFFTGTDGEF